jgi:hypothetical protein
MVRVLVLVSEQLGIHIQPVWRFIGSGKLIPVFNHDAVYREFGSLSAWGEGSQKLQTFDVKPPLEVHIFYAQVLRGGGIGF